MMSSSKLAETDLDRQLLEAVKKKDAGRGKLLLEEGTGPNIPDDDGAMLLWWATNDAAFVNILA